MGLGFTGTATVRLVFTRDVAPAPEAVPAARPTQGGREVRLRGGLRSEEAVLVAKVPEVYA